MKLSTYWNLFLKKTKALRPARSSFRNMCAVLQSSYRKTIDGVALPRHIYEQIIWRRTQVMAKSPICWDSGECRVCGCDILGKTMEDRQCSAVDIGEPPCYPPIMGKDQWATYKILNHIKLFL